MALLPIVLLWLLLDSSFSKLPSNTKARIYNQSLDSNLIGGRDLYILGMHFSERSSRGPNCSSIVRWRAELKHCSVASDLRKKVMRDKNEWMKTGNNLSILRPSLNNHLEPDSYPSNPFMIAHKLESAFLQYHSPDETTCDTGYYRNNYMHI